MAHVQVQETDAQIAGRAIVARDFVYVDWDQVDNDLANAFAFLSSLRIERVQLWATDQVSLQNGPISAKPDVPTLPTIQGKIVGLEPLDVHGAATTANAAHSLAFTIDGTTSVTVPKSAIGAAIGGLNPIAGLVVGGLLSTLGSNVMITIGHTAINVPIVRDANNRVTQIGSSKRPK
jgi:hypothetical protein